MNVLPGVASYWTQGNTRLMLNSLPTASEHVLNNVVAMDGMQRRADSAKIDLFWRYTRA